MFDEATIRRLWPNGDTKVPGLIAGIAAAAPIVFPKYGIKSDLAIRHVMAQISHECGAGTEVIENLNYSAEGLMKTWPSRFNAAKAAEFAKQPQKIANEVYNGRMGNAAGSNDGWNYRGRGGSQTTGKKGYERVKAKTGIDVVGNPAALIDRRYFLECAVADFILCGCLPYAEADDIEGVTKHLNGGLIGIDDRRIRLAEWKAVDVTLTSAPPDIPKPTGPPAAPAPSGWFFNVIIPALIAMFGRK